jgi:hypothetical protein
MPRLQRTGGDRSGFGILRETPCVLHHRFAA